MITKLRTAETFPHRSQGQETEIKVSAGFGSLRRLQGRILPGFCLASGGSWKSFLNCSCITPISASVTPWSFPCVCLSPSLHLLRMIPSLGSGSTLIQYGLGFLGGASGQEFVCQCRRHRDVGSIPGSGKSPGVGNGNQFQYACLENSVGRRAWQAIVCGAAKSRTRLSDQTQSHITSS